jgi:hypothetical protein
MQVTYQYKMQRILWFCILIGIRGYILMPPHVPRQPQSYH